jgi:asparagine synthase (glutamine-hydrolysing)
LEYGSTLADVWFLERCTFAPWEIQQLLGPERAEASLLALDIDSILAAALTPMPATAVGVVAALEGGLSMRNQLLRDSDWAGMAHSLEIRVPLVDSLSLRPLAGVLTQASAFTAGKHSLGVAPRPPLPTAVTSRSKTGFAVPMAERAVGRPEFDDWKAVRLLAHPRCKWDRRWSYVIARQFQMI